MSQRKTMETTSDIMERCTDGTGRGVATFYVRMIVEKKGEKRYKVARELQKYLNGEFRDESSEFQQEFINYIDSKHDNYQNSKLLELINATNEKGAEKESSREAAIILIVLLAEPMVTIEGGTRVVRFAHYILKVLLEMEESGMELGARGLAYLIQTSKAYAAELVEKCLDQSLEWAEDDSPIHTEGRRLAAAILLRELALFTSTAFFIRANSFFKNIFTCLRYPKTHVRIAAASALHAALAITSQREAKQKNEWYKKCFQEALSNNVDCGDGLSRDERCHCLLLVFNEILRIADSNVERARIIAMELNNEKKDDDVIGSPLEFLSIERFQSSVESRTARALVTENTKLIYDKIIECRNCRQQYVQNALIEVLPRMSYWLTSIQLASCMDILIPILSRSPNAQISAALFVLHNPKSLKKYVPQLMNVIKEALLTSKKKRIDIPNDTKLFVLLRYIVRAYKQDINNELKEVLSLLLTTPLSRGLKDVLHEIYDNLADLRTDVLDGLLEQLSLILMGESLPAKTSPPTKPLVPTKAIDTSRDNVERCVLALDTLGQFKFQRHSLQMFIHFIADGYLICDSSQLRLAAVKCCVAMLEPFIKVYERVVREHRQWVLALIHSVLKCLVSVAVVDSDVDVRMCVVRELSNGDGSLLSHLAQPQVLELLRLCLRDEKLEMQEASVCLLGKIGMLNPALILPRLRRVILETLGQLTNSGDGRLEQHSARLIAQMANQSPKFMRPYMGSLLEALIPKLRTEQKYVDVTVHVLDSISELSIVGGSEVVRSIDVLFPKLIHFITDGSSVKRREAALRAIGHLSASTAYVVDPYRDHPQLLEILLSLMKSEMSQTMRRQTMRVLGTLGALDPYTHKVFTGSVYSAANLVTAALSMPLTRKVVDPRQDIIQWFNYEKCTLEEFYPSITIANLLLLLENDAYSMLFAEIIQDLLSIFRTLGNQCPQFVAQVVPQLIETTKKCKGEFRGFFLQQLAATFDIIRNQGKPYLEDVFKLLAKSWKDDDSLRSTVIGVIEMIGLSLENNFAPYIAEVIPYLLEAMRSDREQPRTLTANSLRCICALSGTLSCHLHLIIPPILSVVDDHTAPSILRSQALDSLQVIADKEDLSDYSPRIIQSWIRSIHMKDLQSPSLILLKVMLKQRWKHLDVFQRTIETSLMSNQLHCPEYTNYLRDNGQSSKNETFVYSSLHFDKESQDKKIVVDDSNIAHHKINRITKARPLQPIHTGPTKQKINVDVVRRSCQVWNLVSKEDWSAWLNKLRISFIRSSSSPSIRAVSSLADIHHPLAKDLFNAAFMSVWTELNEDLQNEVTNNLMKALETCNHPDVIQTILNLAEFMDHSEKGPLPIRYAQLGKSAQEVKAYAKALRYKELEIKKLGKEISLEDAHSLITFANKLNLQEEAAGVIKYAEMKNKEISMLMRSRWYEKLNDWDKSLDLLNECRKDKEKDCKDDELDEHELKCLEALGRWSQLNKKVDGMTLKDHKVCVIAARGSWASGEWNKMEKYTEDINGNTQDGSYLRAVLALKNEKYSEANEYIEKCRDIHDAQLTAMASESYERSYGAMVLVQELTELEEAMEYRLRPERRARIALLWSRRLQGCRQNVDQWHKLLMLRSLVLSPSEMHPLRVKFSSLCRKQNKLSMCTSELASLLGLPPGAELHSATPPLDRPQLVLALCKQLWLDDLKRAAVSTLEGLSRHLDRLPNSSHSKETKRLVAKTFLKLGEWTQSEDTSLAPMMERRSTLIRNDPSSNIVSARTSAVAALHSGLAVARLPPLTDGLETTKIIRYYTKATEYDPTWHKGWHRLATTYFNAMSREKEKEKLVPSVDNDSLDGLSFIASRPITPLTSYAVEAVKAFTRALQLAHGSRLEDTLRLLTLWFEFGERDEVYEELRECQKSLPLDMWLEVTPQLMARLDSSSRPSILLHQVVLEVAKSYPQSMVYALTVARASPNEVRSKNAAEMLSLLSDLHSNLVEQADMVSKELVRCAILWHEQWHEALDEASRMYFQDKNIKAMLEILEPMHRLLDAGPTTLKEHSFNQTYLCDLQDARKFCQAFQRTANGKELTQAWELYYAIFKRIAQQLRTMSSLDLNYISPILQKAKELDLSIPGTFDPSVPLVTIYSFGSHLQVISSKQRPRKMTMRGSDGKEYCFLLKGHEDPRQDERVMQFFGLVNTLLLHNNDTCRRNLTIQRYSIIPLSQNSGLIGWVPNCDTLHALVKDYREKKKTSLSLEHKVMQGVVADLEQLTLLQKVQLFERALESSDGEDLSDILWLKSPNSEVWFERRTNYTRSMACMSMVGHILGLGDRHPSNLMLDRLTGKIVHIDFGDCFEVAQTREKYPERIPFRLTRMLVNAMEITGIEGNYRLTSQRVLQVLRSKKDSLLAVLEAFVYDPLINWRLLDVNKRNPIDKKEILKAPNITEVPENVSSAVLDRIKLKLSGREFDPQMECTLEDHVDRLVEQARLHSNLAQCYIGWCPFW